MLCPLEEIGTAELIMSLFDIKLSGKICIIIFPGFFVGLWWADLCGSAGQQSYFEIFPFALVILQIKGTKVRGLYSIKGRRIFLRGSSFQHSFAFQHVSHSLIHSKTLGSFPRSFWGKFHFFVENTFPWKILDFSKQKLD